MVYIMWKVYGVLLRKLGLFCRRFYTKDILYLVIKKLRVCLSVLTLEGKGRDLKCKIDLQLLFTPFFPL